MFDGMKNSIKNTVVTGQQASETFINMAKEMKSMPFRKLKPLQIAYLVVAIIIFIVMAFVVFPILN